MAKKPCRPTQESNQEAKTTQELFALGREFGREVLFGDLETLANLENSTFMASLKRFITRRERPSKIFSDNGRAFMGAAKPIKGIEKDKEQMEDCLTS